MSNPKWLCAMLGTVLVLAGLWTSPAAQSGTGSGVIQGSVKSADGAPMEGVIVSARASDKSFTTSVWITVSMLSRKRKVSDTSSKKAGYSTAKRLKMWAVTMRWTS